MKNIFIKSTAKNFLLIICSTILITGCTQKIKWKVTESVNFNTVTNDGGKTLGYSKSSNVILLFDDGYAFKDLNKNGTLDKYEDWRLSADSRATDLASKMSIEQIAGLMLYSRHQSIPARGRGYMGGTYGGKKYDESGAKPADLSDDQIKFLTDDNVRHVLLTSVESPAIAAEWNNNAQALVEKLGLGIPVNNSSDPRHRTRANAEYNAGAGGNISMWPGSLGLAATFDPDLIKAFGNVASKEYRALGITTALSPQIDLATEPRWNRVNGTFGEDPLLSSDLSRAYIDGFQSSYNSDEIDEGWGFESVNTMVKHWPGGGTGEGGRDAHFIYGKFGVYPGQNFEEQLIPFLDGAFKLEGVTKTASAVMPYYTISYNQDPSGENLANAYSKYIIHDLLREKYGYDGVVCTDWGVTPDPGELGSFFTGKCFGAEDLSIAERHYMVLMAGVDQFGGNNEAEPILEAFEIGKAEHGEAAIRTRFEQSAIRLLKNIFRVGLFENPYLEVEESTKIVGNPEFMAAGYEAQLKSIVMLKNKGNSLPVSKNMTVYIPKRFTPAGRNFMGGPTPEKLDYPINIEIVKKLFKITEDPNQADFALVCINNPNSGGGYNTEDVAGGGTGYLPISLQYNEYTAEGSRIKSIAGGDPQEGFTNRSYEGKSVTASNYTDLQMVLNTRKIMKDKPVIVSLQISNPLVFEEFEKAATAILVNFGVQDQAILNIIVGNNEPSGLLPIQMPENMATVESQAEDTPHDMTVYEDSEGNVYDFGFGLNWKGIIQDDRTSKYIRY